MDETVKVALQALILLLASVITALAVQIKRSLESSNAIGRINTYTLASVKGEVDELREAVIRIDTRTRHLAEQSGNGAAKS